MLTTVVLFAVSNGTRLVAIPLFGEKDANLTPVEIGTVLSISAFFNLLSLIRSGSWIDKFGTRPVMIVGFTLTGLSTASFILTRDFLGMSIVSAVYGFSTGILSPGPAVMIMDAADPNHRGLVVGFFRIFSDIGIITGPIALGVMADYLGLRDPFIVVGAVCLLTALGSFAFKQWGSAEPLGDSEAARTNLIPRR